MVPKYRFWHIAEKKMYEVLSINSMTGMVEVEGGKYFLVPQDGFLMEFTGLFGKDGVEIFEGDVVSFEMFKVKMTGEVVYEKESGSYALNILTYPEINEVQLIYQFRNMEVIGNIYENPELMEVANV